MRGVKEIQWQRSPGFAVLRVVSPVTTEQDPFAKAVFDAHPGGHGLLIGFEIHGPMKVWIGDQLMSRPGLMLLKLAKTADRLIGG